MPAIDSHPAGSFCWTELATTDVDAALAFYGALFGWDPEPGDLGDSGRYVRCNLNGKPVAAILEMSEEEQAFKASPQWLHYVAVEDLDDALIRAEDLGGTRFEGPLSVPEAGRLGTVEDPDGAKLCLWQAENFHGSAWHRELNAPAWREIMTRKADEVSDFYTRLLGWQPTQRQMGESTYTTFVSQGEGVGGLEAMGEEHAGVPPQWMLYIAVANLRSTLEAAQALDAKVIRPATEMPGVGTVATLTDPKGAIFSVIQMHDLAR